LFVGGEREREVAEREKEINPLLERERERDIVVKQTVFS